MRKRQKEREQAVREFTAAQDVRRVEVSMENHTHILTDRHPTGAGWN